MLVGRTTECRSIDRLLADVRSGRGGALVLIGDPGIGKTSLLEYALRQAPDMRALHVLGVEAEAALPYAGLHGLLRPVLDGLAELPERQARAIRVALGQDEEGATDALAVYGGVLALLAEAAFHEPLIVVDDAHWLDAETVRAMGFVARRIADESLAIMFGARELPGAVEESVPRGEEAVDALPRSAAIERAFLRRSEELSEVGREALLLAACGEDDAEIVRSLDPRMAGGLEEAQRVGLFKQGRGRLDFWHPLVRSAVYSGATEADRRAAHLVLANALAVDQPVRSAWHLVLSGRGPDESVARILASAMDWAWNTLDLDRSRALIDEAVAAVRGDVQAADRELLTAIAWQRLADLQVDEALAAARTLTGDSGSAPDLQVAQAADVLSAADRLEEARSALGGAIAELTRLGHLPTLAYSLSSQATIELRRGRLLEAVKLAGEAQALSDEGAASFAGMADAEFATVEATVGMEGACRSHAARASESFGGRGRWAQGQSQAAIGLLELGLGNDDEARVALDRAHELLAPVRHPGLVRYAGDRIEVLVRLGQPEAARDAIRDLQERNRTGRRGRDPRHGRRARDGARRRLRLHLTRPSGPEGHRAGRAVRGRAGRLSAEGTS